MPTEFPNKDEIEFKQKFVERYNKLTDFSDFEKYSLSFLDRSIRVNTIKADVKQIREQLTAKKWKLTAIPWCKEGFFIEGERRDIGNLREHVLGYVYVQEAASMIPPVVLGPQDNELILDMCAAPGSKTTQLAQYMHNTGLIVANDNSYQRLKALSINLQRCGVFNVVMTNTEGFLIQGIEFDRVLADVPCSATGTIRKSLKTINMWNPKVITQLSSLQKKLASHGFELLKPGGTLVYSTCTMEPEEDEGVVDFLLNKYHNAKIQKIDLDIKRSKAVTEFEGRTYSDKVKHCLRIWPQDNNTSGFFVAKITKK